MKRETERARGTERWRERETERERQREREVQRDEVRDWERERYRGMERKKESTDPKEIWNVGCTVMLRGEILINCNVRKALNLQGLVDFFNTASELSVFSFCCLCGAVISVRCLKATSLPMLHRPLRLKHLYCSSKLTFDSFFYLIYNLPSFFGLHWVLAYFWTCM